MENPDRPTTFEFATLAKDEHEFRRAVFLALLKDKEFNRITEETEEAAARAYFARLWRLAQMAVEVAR